MRAALLTVWLRVVCLSSRPPHALETLKMGELHSVAAAAWDGHELK